MAMEGWVRTSVEGLGSGSRRGAPAVVPGQPAIRPGRERLARQLCLDFIWLCLNQFFSKFLN
jgi:hypothetical protein